MLGIVKRTFIYLEKDIFLRLYKMLIRPHLEYATCVWNPWLVKDTHTIERVQQRATN